MRQHVGDAGVQFAGCAAVENLAANADNKAKIVADGGLQLVLEAELHGSEAGTRGLAELNRWGSLVAMLCFLLVSYVAGSEG
eukprot:1161616-Rhodomonas_salina.1